MLCIEKTILGIQKEVIYIQSQNSCEELAAQLGCNHYHSNIVEKG